VFCVFVVAGGRDVLIGGFEGVLLLSMGFFLVVGMIFVLGPFGSSVVVVVVVVVVGSVALSLGLVCGAIVFCGGESLEIVVVVVVVVVAGVFDSVLLFVNVAAFAVVVDLGVFGVSKGDFSVVVGSVVEAG
ncbi:MAG: hypothetical protein AAFQ69_21420, partial [Pseudomonadota bacterium]